MSSFLIKMSKIRLFSVSDSKLDFRFKMYPRILIMFSQYMSCLKYYCIRVIEQISKTSKKEEELAESSDVRQGWAFCDFFWQNKISVITSKLLRILTEHIQQKVSTDSKLEIESICSVVVFNIFEVIAFTRLLNSYKGAFVRDYQVRGLN